METYSAIASKRDLRSYSPDPVPEEKVGRILDAGRVAGSGKNRQNRRFVVLTEIRERAARTVTRPANLEASPLVVAIVVGEGPYSLFDAGRAAQNMMLAGWDAGIASCPNSVADPDALSSLLELGDGERVAILLSFGLPAKGFDPEARAAAEWIEAADRVPVEQAVQYR